MNDIDPILQACTNVLPGHGPKRSVAETLSDVAASLSGDEMQDVYGVGEHLEAFEAEVARMFDKPAAVFMPSGTMAQQIALRIWCDRTGRTTVAMHPTAHLEFAEHLGYRFLHGLSRIQFASPEFLQHRMLTLKDFEGLGATPGAVLIELPYRPLGGQLPTFDEICAISEWSRGRGIPLHLDGARIWQCRPFLGRSFEEIGALFDSIYVSFYKDLGGLGGCVLMGPEDFVAESRVWQRRYGGNLYTQAPFVAAARQGLQNNLPRLDAFVSRAREVASVLSGFERIRVNPQPPHVNFFQVFIEGEAEYLTARHHELAQASGTFLFHRLAPAEVPGWATTEMHLFGNALAFDLSKLEPFLKALLGGSGGVGPQQ